MDIIKSIVDALIAQGPIGILAAVCLVGWVVCGWLYYKKLQVKDETSKLRDNHIKEVKRIHEEYNKRIFTTNEDYSRIILETADKRVADIKELSEDYNNLATDTLKTLDRLIYQIEVRKNNDNSNKGGL